MADGTTSLELGLEAVIVAVTDEVPRVLAVQRERRSQGEALPSGPLDPDGDRTLELGLRGWVREQTGIELGYVEQLYTFGDRHRGIGVDPAAPRVISVAYLALVKESPLSSSGAQWRDIYRFLPWEDWRDGQPSLLELEILPRLQEWERDRDRATRAQRRERIAIAFGSFGSPWDSERVLERYELLYEAGLVGEALLDGKKTQQPSPGQTGSRSTGQRLDFDHRRILATALGRMRGKLKYRPVVFELIPELFTLLRLQRVVEALAGMRIHKQNFRRLVDKGGLVEGTGRIESNTGGRPAELFRFRREVLMERPAAGVGLPGLPG